MYGEVYDNAPTCLDRLRHEFSFLKPVRDDYPLVPIEDGFNWSECVAGISLPSLYLVVFRSVRRADADLDVLRAFDDRAFEDARQAPGFLFYFKGQVTPDRECLSFCLWSTQEQAREASSRPAHAAAAGLVERMYESYELERYTFSKHDEALIFARMSY